MDSHSPTDGKLIASAYSTRKADYEKVIQTAQKGFEEWRTWPAPKRGEVVRQFGEVLRENKQALGKVSELRNGQKLSRRFGRGTRDD